MKEKYINAYLMTESDEDIMTVEEIVGYYLFNYKEEALSMWTYNLKYARYKWSTDEEVTKVLTELFA